MPLLKPIRALQVNWSHPLARGLAGCWLMNEGTGEKVADYGLRRQVGSFYYSTAAPAWKPGKNGPCIEFGADRCIDCGTGRFGWDITNEVSVVALVNQSANQTNTIFGRSAYCRPARLHAQSNGRISWRVFTDTANDCIISSTSLHATDGSEWVHAAGTWRQHDARLYVNAVQEASNTATDGNLTVTDGQFVGIGGNYEGGYLYCFNGRIEYVFIYNRALSPEEIRWLYREPFAMFESRISSASLNVGEAIVFLAGSASAASTASAKLESIAGSPIIELNWLADALFNGMTANAFKLGTTLSLGWFWVRLNGCSALYRGASMERIDFANILAVAEQEAAAISPPSYVEHEPDSTYFYAVRRFNNCGYQELTLAAAAKVSLDANGWLIGSQPNNIFSSIAEQVAAAKVRLTWYYCPLEQRSQPVRFNIYHDNRTGQIDYDNPMATITYRGQKFYTYQSDTLEAGRYLLVIRAEDADGIENSPSAQLSIQLKTENPDPIEIISAESV
ncbi:MAG: LamG domain-containing protein [Planctomycetota bacterium]